MPKLGPIDWRTLAKIFEAEGFKFERQRGSHRVYSKPGVRRPVIIPAYDEISQDIIKSNLKTAGISLERYFELLKNH